MIRAGAPPRCHTLIVGLTANTLPSDRAACEAAGMNGFVTKPVTLDRLRTVLDHAAGHGPESPHTRRRRMPRRWTKRFLAQLAGESIRNASAK